jgi:hypothetical protein
MMEAGKLVDVPARRQVLSGQRPRQPSFYQSDAESRTRNVSSLPRRDVLSDRRAAWQLISGRSSASETAGEQPDAHISIQAHPSTFLEEGGQLIISPT